jgi:hypothetical protein
MKKFYVLKPLAFFVIVLSILLQWYFNADRSLQRGQAIMQAHSHSIATSLVTNWTDRAEFSPIRTWLPCPHLVQSSLSERPWAEEPPLFHFLGALLKLIGIKSAWVLPIILHLLLWPLLLLIFSKFESTRDQKWWWSTFAFLSPAWVRYGVQFMPDTLAIVFLLCAFHESIRKDSQSWKFYGFSTLAITTKALNVVPLLGIFLAGVFLKQKSRIERVKHLLLFALCSLPLVLWLGILKWNDIPNPFFLKADSTELRHTGSLSLLFEAKYLSRFVTWNFIKGAGFVASAVVLWGVWQGLRSRFEVNFYPKTLWAWIAMLLPYWLFVRDANYVHDYYSLPFVLGLMIFAALTLSYRKGSLFLVGIPTLSMLLGLSQIYSLAKNPPKEVQFCDAELSHIEGLSEK